MAAALSFFGNEHIDMGVVNQTGGLQGRVHPGMDARGFSDEIDRLTGIHPPRVVLRIRQARQGMLEAMAARPAGMLMLAGAFCGLLCLNIVWILNTQLRGTTRYD